MQDQVRDTKSSQRSEGTVLEENIQVSKQSKANLKGPRAHQQQLALPTDVHFEQNLNWSQLKSIFNLNATPVLQRANATQVPHFAAKPVSTSYENDSQQKHDSYTRNSHSRSQRPHPGAVDHNIVEQNALEGRTANPCVKQTQLKLK